MKSITKIILSLSICFTMFPSVANAKEVKKQSSIMPLTSSQALKYLNESNIPSDKKKILMDKLEKGELWDCYNPEKIKQMPKDFSKFEISGKEQRKVYKFEDGSSIEVGIVPGEVTEVTSENVNQIDKDGKLGIKQDADLKSVTTSYESIGAIDTPMSVVTSDSFGALYTNSLVYKEISGTSAWYYANFYVSRYGNSIIYTAENSSGTFVAPFGHELHNFGTSDYKTEMIRDRENRDFSSSALYRMQWATQLEVSAGWNFKVFSAGATLSKGTTISLYLALNKGQVYIDSVLPYGI